MSTSQDDYIYCSPFLPVASTDAILAAPDTDSTQVEKFAISNLRASEPAPEDALIQEQTVSLIHTAIAQLPCKQITVIWDYFFDGLSLSEIAQKENVSVSAISQRKSAAQAALAQRLTPTLIETLV